MRLAADLNETGRQDKVNEYVFFFPAALFFQTGARGIAGGAMLCKKKSETTFFIWVGFLNKAKTFFYLVQLEIWTDLTRIFVRMTERLRN